MSVKTPPIEVDVERVKEAGEKIFGKDRMAWCEKANVSLPTLRLFLNGDYVKLYTMKQIVEAAGLSLDVMVRVKNGNGRKGTAA